MSEIYAPGSIAGPQGPAGPAGSAAAVSALAAAIMPSFVGVNLFDAAKITPGNQVSAADGTLSTGAPSDASALIYCPGATSMVSNMAINACLWGGGVCLYDANGAFLSALPSTAFSSLFNGGAAAQGAAFTLPGTQTYVRLCHVTSWDGPWGVTNANGMIYATIAGTATLPASYQPCGLDTIADVNAKCAAIVANSAAALTSTVTNIGAGLGLFVQTMLSAPDGGLRNALDVSKTLADTAIHSDGTKSTSAGWQSALVFAPGATQFITNLPIRCQGPSGVTLEICTYDAFGNFLAAVGSTTPNSISGLIAQNHVYALPGNQTYVGFTWSRSNYGWGPDGSGNYYCVNDGGAMFIVGNSANPCPASLPPGAPVTGSLFTRIKTATQLGADPAGVVDCTALLNAFLATASAANPIKLILDGVFLTTGLAISTAGYTTIEGTGWGSGLKLANGANRNAITCDGTGTVGDYSIFGTNTATPPARVCSNVTIGNFTLDPNGSNNINSMGLGFVNTTNILVEKMNFKAATWFATCFANCGFIKAYASQFISSGTLHDGLHFDGLCEDVAIDSCYFSTGDDAIALNAPEGYGGDISRVTITNCIFGGSLTVLRAYTSIDATHMPGGNNVHKIRGVVVSNCTGHVTGYCFNFGITGGGLSSTLEVDQLQDFSVANCTLSGPDLFAWFGTTAGSVAFRGIKFIPTSTNAVVVATYPVGELTLNDFTVLRNADGNSAPAALIQTTNNGNFDRLSLLHCRVVDEHGSSYAAIPCLLDLQAATNAVRLEDIDLTHVTALTSGAGWDSVTALRGAGVLGSGAQVPDAVMDAGTLYLSSNASGAPSIKVGGAAKRLTLA